MLEVAAAQHPLARELIVLRIKVDSPFEARPTSYLVAHPAIAFTALAPAPPHAVLAACPSAMAGSCMRYNHTTFWLTPAWPFPIRGMSSTSRDAHLLARAPPLGRWNSCQHRQNARARCCVRPTAPNW